MRLVVDTNVLWDRIALPALAAQKRPAILPAVAFIERARQLLQAGRTVDELWQLARDFGMEIEPLLPEHGLRMAARLDDATWRRHARDAMIASHVGPDDVLWTKNPKDFLAVGLRPDQIVAV